MMITQLWIHLHLNHLTKRTFIICSQSSSPFECSKIPRTKERRFARVNTVWVVHTDPTGDQNVDRPILGSLNLGGWGGGEEGIHPLSGHTSEIELLPTCTGR